MRIAIMGYVGSGKTYLSQYLSKKYDIPVLHLDEIYFDKEWRPVEKSTVLTRTAEFMENDGWIIDGFYRDVLMEERLEKADRIVLLLLPRITCLLRALRRTKSRVQAGYKNDLNWWFIEFALFGCRTKVRQEIYSQIAHDHHAKTVVLRSRRQVRSFLSSIDESCYNSVIPGYNV